MNKFEQLVSESTMAVAVAGTAALDRFELLLLDGPNADAVAAAEKCGLQFVGVLTLDKHFSPRTAFALELPLEAEKTIAADFLAIFERVISQMEQTHWLQTQTN
ncbi:MAG: hypothetical protein JWQ87_1805 [Candidatus Sulfotelmatobacter sp.]|nr:hypothetical protein [Candidatus Sulfotelmatobacter sp.]